MSAMFQTPGHFGRVAQRFIASLALILLPSLASAALTSGAWAPTKTQAMPAPKGAVQVGPLADATPMHLLVSLQINNRAQLEALARSVNTPGNPAFGNYLKVGQFVDLYAPTALQVQS